MEEEDQEKEKKPISINSVVAAKEKEEKEEVCVNVERNSIDSIRDINELLFIVNLNNNNPQERITTAKQFTIHVNCSFNLQIHPKKEKKGSDKDDKDDKHDKFEKEKNSSYENCRVLIERFGYDIEKHRVRNSFWTWLWKGRYNFESDCKVIEKVLNEIGKEKRNHSEFSYFLDFIGLKMNKRKRGNGNVIVQSVEKMIYGGENHEKFSFALAGVRNIIEKFDIAVESCKNFNVEFDKMKKVDLIFNGDKKELVFVSKLIKNSVGSIKMDNDHCSVTIDRKKGLIHIKEEIPKWEKILEVDKSLEINDVLIKDDLQVKKLKEVWLSVKNEKKLIQIKDFLTKLYNLTVIDYNPSSNSGFSKPSKKSKSVPSNEGIRDLQIGFFDTKRKFFQHFKGLIDISKKKRQIENFINTDIDPFTIEKILSFKKDFLNLFNKGKESKDAIYRFAEMEKEIKLNPYYKKPVVLWSVEDVHEWLKTIFIDYFIEDDVTLYTIFQNQFREMFEGNPIDGTFLLKLASDKDLFEKFSKMLYDEVGGKKEVGESDEGSKKKEKNIRINNNSIIKKHQIYFKYFDCSVVLRSKIIELKSNESSLSKYQYNLKIRKMFKNQRKDWFDSIYKVFSSSTDVDVFSYIKDLRKEGNEFKDEEKILLNEVLKILEDDECDNLNEREISRRQSLSSELYQYKKSIIKQHKQDVKISIDLNCLKSSIKSKIFKGDGCKNGQCILCVKLKLSKVEDDVNPLYKAAIKVAKKFSKKKFPFGNFHSGVIIQGCQFDWYSHSMCEIERYKSGKCMLVYDYDTIRVFTNGVDEFVDDIARYIINWNLTKEYDSVKTNCQIFTLDFLDYLYEKEYISKSGSKIKLSDQVKSWNDRNCTAKLKDTKMDLICGGQFRKDCLGVDNFKEGESIVFESHPSLSEFMHTYFDADEKFRILKNKFKPEYDLLKGFCRAFWLRHSKIEKEKGLKYTGGCLFCEKLANYLENDN